MCVCESISPGRTVAPERSMVFAPEGIFAAAPSRCDAMRLPRPTMTWFFFGSPDLPSIRVPARITVTEPCGAFCAPAEFAAAKAAIKAPSQASVNFCMIASAFLFFQALFQNERYRDTLFQREFQPGLCAIVGHSERGASPLAPCALPG